MKRKLLLRRKRWLKLPKPKLRNKENSLDWVLIGLGNPGAEYEYTRHNAGFWVVDALAKQAGVPFRKPFFSSFQWAEIHGDQGNLILVKPLTYMNRSGEIIPALVRKFSSALDQLVVIVDQMDLPPGGFRLKPAGGSAGHNGLKSMEAHLGTTAYKRLYVGIGRPGDGNIVPWVLGRPPQEEADLLFSAVEKLTGLLGGLPGTAWEKFLTTVNSAAP